MTNIPLGLPVKIDARITRRNLVLEMISVPDEHRGKGYATEAICRLEKIAAILETGFIIHNVLSPKIAAICQNRGYKLRKNGKVHSYIMVTKANATHFVHRNDGGAIYVKDAKLFKEQGGLQDEWGKAWKPVIAKNLTVARYRATGLYRGMVCRS